MFGFVWDVDHGIRSCSCPVSGIAFSCWSCIESCTVQRLPAGHTAFIHMLGVCVSVLRDRASGGPLLAPYSALPCPCVAPPGPCWYRP